MNIFLNKGNKGHFASSINKVKSLLMTALLLFSQIPSIADTADIQDADGTVLTLPSGSITTGDSGDPGLTSGVVAGKQDNAIYILDSENTQTNLSGVALTTYGYEAHGVYILGNTSDSSQYSNNTINMSGGSIVTKGAVSRGLFANYSDNTAISLSGGSIITGDSGNPGLTNSVNYGEEGHGIYVSYSNNSNVNISAGTSITTYGYQANGVYVQGINSDSSLYTNNSIHMSGGTIVTKAKNARGIYSYYSDNTAINFSGGSITTGDAGNIGLTSSIDHGEDGHGIYVYYSNNSNIAISGTSSITTYGHGASGVYVVGDGSDTSLYANHTINMSGGTIITKGRASTGMNSRSIDNTAINFSGGSITTANDARGIGILGNSLNTIITIADSASITASDYAIYTNSTSNNTTLNVIGTGWTIDGSEAGSMNGVINEYVGDSAGDIRKLANLGATEGATISADQDFSNQGVINNSLTLGTATAGNAINTVLTGGAVVDAGTGSDTLTLIDIDDNTTEIGTTGSTETLRGFDNIYLDNSNFTGALDLDTIADEADNIISLANNSSITGDIDAGVGNNDTFIVGLGQTIASSDIHLEGNGVAAGEKYRNFENLEVYGTITGAVTYGATDDTLTIGVNTIVDSVDFGGGIDTLILGIAGNFDATKINTDIGSGLDFENLEKILGNSENQTWTVTANDAGLTEIDLASGSDTLNVAVGQTIAGTSINNASLYLGIDNLTVAGTITGATDLSTADSLGATINVSGTTGDITSGSEVDTFTISGNTGNLLAAESDDTFTISGSGTIGTVDGGDNNDTLTLNTFTGTLGAVSNVETIAVNDSIFTANFSGASDVTLTGATTSVAGTINMTVGGDTLTLEGGAAATGVVDFLGGTDTLIFDGSFDATQINTDIGSGLVYSNLENVQGTGAAETWTVSANDSTLNQIDFLGGTDTLIFAGSFDATNIGAGLLYRNLENVQGTGAAETWTVSANDAGLNQIDLLGGVDTLVVNNGTTINGSDISATGLYRGIDNLTINGTISGTTDLSAADAGSSTIDLGSTAIIGSLITGTGNDTLNVAGGASMGSINLGTGSNTLNLNGDATLTGTLTGVNTTLNLDTNALTVNGTANLTGATVNVTVLPDGSSGSIAAAAIIVNGGSLNLSVGAGFSPGDLVDKDLNAILVSNDIQDGSGGQVANRYAGFDSFTYSPLLRVYDDGTLVYEGFSAGTSESSTAAALDANTAILDDSVISNFISTASTSELEEFVEDTRPQPTMAIETINLAVDTAVTSVNNRFSTLGVIFTPKSSGDEDLHPEESFWMEALYSKIDKENTSSALGYNASVTGTSIGYDQSFNGLTLGAAYSFYSGRTTNSNGYVESDIHQLSFYGMKEFKAFYFKTIVGGGLANNDSVRRISAVGQEAAADYQSYNYFADIELGKNIEFNDFSFAPYIGAKFTHVESESYSESGAGILNLSMDKNNTDNFEALIGFRVATQIFLADDSLLIPHFGLSVGKNYGDDTNSSTGRFSNGQVNFTSSDMDVEEYHYDFSSGFSWQVKENLEFKFNYSVRYAEDYLEQAGTLDISIRAY